MSYGSIVALKVGSWATIVLSAWAIIANIDDSLLVAVAGAFWVYYGFAVLRLIDILEQVAAWYQEYERNNHQ